MRIVLAALLLSLMLQSKDALLLFSGIDPVAIAVWIRVGSAVLVTLTTGGVIYLTKKATRLEK